MSLRTDIQPFTSEQSDVLSQVLTARLATDSWRKTQENKLLELRNPKTESPNADTLKRWIFVDDEVAEALAEMEKNTTNNPPAPKNSKGDKTTSETVATKTENSIDKKSAVQATTADKKTTANTKEVKAASSAVGSIPEKTKPPAETFVSSRTNTAAEQSTSGQAESWDGFFPLRTSDILERMPYSRLGPAEFTRRSTNHLLLSKLARKNNLIGWNAAILWAQTNPAQAKKTARILEQLVTNPPQYNTKTSEAVDLSGDSDDQQNFLSDASTIKSNSISEKFRSLTGGVFSSRDNNHASKNRNASSPKTSSKNSGKTTTTNEDDQPESEVELTTVSRSMQAAAAEAWCRVLAESSEDHLRALSPIGKILEEPDLPVEVRAELFRSLARWVAPDFIPRLSNALRQSDEGKRAPVEIRRAAIDACLIFAIWNPQAVQPATTDTSEETLAATFDESTWPATIWNCRWDPDPHVRRTFGRWLAVIQHPDAMETFQAQLRDTEIRVRESAIVSLGILGTDEAKETLQQQVQRPEIRIRQFAVTGLSYWGFASIAPLAKDRSHDVRQTVAQELARFPEAEAALIQRDLLTDSNIQVQAKVIRSISDWPDHLAIPLLLHGLRDASRANREACLVQLNSRTGMRKSFPFDAPRQQRAQAVMNIVRSKNLPYGFFEELQERGSKFTSAPDQTQIDEIWSMLDRLTKNPQHSAKFNEAHQQLLQRNSEDVGIIEKYLTSHPQINSSIILHDILPKLDAAYVSLVDLESSDVGVRRRAAQALAKTGENTSLSPFVVKQLQTKMTIEQDRLVWQYTMKAVMQDGSDENAQIALLAVNNSWPDVRKLGCQYIGRHEHPQHALWLIPLFFDSDTSVQLAAIEAVGRCHNPLVLDGVSDDIDAEPIRGLRSLLMHPDQNLRFAVVIAMSRLGDPQGTQEMVRLGYHPESNIREDVIQAMGESGQSRFIEHLLRLAWTETNDLVKRAILQSLDQLVPAVEHPGGLAERSNYDDKIKLWVDWWKQKHPQATVLTK